MPWSFEGGPHRMRGHSLDRRSLDRRIDNVRTSVDLSGSDGLPPISPRLPHEPSKAASNGWQYYQGNVMQLVGKACPLGMSRPGWWCRDDYVIRNTLYEAGSCKAFHALCRTSGMLVSLKCYDKRRLDDSQHRRIRRVAELHANLDHPNILSLYGAFEDERRYYLVHEASHETVAEELARRQDQMTEKEAVARVLMPILRALDYLHSEGIVHGQVAPANVVFGSGKDSEGQPTAKLANLDAAWEPARDGEKGPVPISCPFEYMPPEMVMDPWMVSGSQGPEGSLHGSTASFCYLNSKADVWSLAVLTFEVLFGFSVFAHDTFNRKDISVSIMSEEPYFYPEIRSLSYHAKDFLLSCLNKALAARPSASEAIGHPWMRSQTAKTESIDGRSSDKLWGKIKGARIQTRPTRRSIQLLPKLTESIHGPNVSDNRPPGSQADSPGTFSMTDLYDASKRALNDCFAASSPRESFFGMYGRNAAFPPPNINEPAEPCEISAVADSLDTGRSTAGHAPATQALMTDSFAFSAPTRPSCPPTTAYASSASTEQPRYSFSSMLEPEASGTIDKDDTQASFAGFSTAKIPLNSGVNSVHWSPTPPAVLNLGEASGHPSPRRRVLNNSKSSKDVTFRPAAGADASAAFGATRPRLSRSLSLSSKVVDSAIF